MVKFMKFIAKSFRDRKNKVSVEGMSPAMRRDIGLPEDPGPPEWRDYLMSPMTKGIGSQDWKGR